MSQVDTRLPPAAREAFLAEIRGALPAFLSGSASEVADPLEDVSNLLNLVPSDLERLIAVHLMLDSHVRDFVGALPKGLRRPVTSSIRPRIVSQAVRGPVDWGATIRHRAVHGGVASDFVVRPAHRIFDTPENRLLSWVLQRLNTLARRVSTSPHEHSSPTASIPVSWISELSHAARTIEQARRTYWLRDIPAEAPGTESRRLVRAARSAFYQENLPAVADLLVSYDAPGEVQVLELLSQRYFVPSEDWRLFEAVVALRLAAQFAESGATQRRSRLLVGGSRGPYARFQLEKGGEVRLWYQTWPHDAGPSLHSAVRARHGIHGQPPRPDIVIEHIRPGGASSAIVLELKATTQGGYLSAGILQLCGYLRDRPLLFIDQPSGWLVAPESEAFHHQKQSGLDIWVVSADQVAAAAVERVMGVFAGVK